MTEIPSHQETAEHRGKETVLGLNLSLPLTYWVAVDKSLNLSEPQLPQLENHFNSQGGY